MITTFFIFFLNTLDICQIIVYDCIILLIQSYGLRNITFERSILWDGISILTDLFIYN